ncbi:hypothetical protein BJ912DRAFT_1022506 [Pholiota molesta]|nr:hypothetical protein BJ912DRAFT_1022506 [Pholiota molesta]
MSNPFLDYLIERTTKTKSHHKKQKRFHSAGSPTEMSFFGTHSNNFLAPSFPSRKKSQRFRDDVEEFLPDDLELSFASNVSLNSPPRELISLTASDCEPMDISPAPVKAHAKQRPRAYTGGSRLFGSDISNNNKNPLLPSPNMAGQAITKPPMREPSSPMDDAMDVDTSFVVDSVAEPVSFSPVATSAAPTITTFNQLFYDTMSPPPPSRRSFESPLGLDNKKRRSLSPESIRSPKFTQDSSPMLPSSPSEAKLVRMGKPGLQGLGAPSAGLLKRPRRPVLSAMVQPFDHGASDDPSPRGSAPVRRAFSAFLPPSIYADHEDEDTSFDGQDMSSPAQAYSKRQQVKTIRRCDGTEDFRPLTGATAMVSKESPSAKFMAAGLPGHIPGAVNINTTSAVEDLLLGTSLTKPRPSVSGDNTRKTILVFHCEFSAKRAPTFAKHLRAKDRAMNNHVYPKIHYPEVYILEGGYCQYFKTSASRCEPPAYVTMDDPIHANSRREELDQFRKAKFGRHKSYAYGDGPGKGLPFGQQPPPQAKRNTVPSAPQSMFAAASAARSRRGGNGLMTLAEDGNPCPPPVKATTFKGKKLVRNSIARAETYGPARMPY